MTKGGYRKPANPAPVSGPGTLSRRTDGKQPVMEMTGGKYGESKELRETQSQAPMYQSSPAPQQKVTNLFAPTERPAEPVTDGMPFGAGANSTAGSVAPSNFSQTLLRALQMSNDPDLEQIYNILHGRGEI